MQVVASGPKYRDDKNVVQFFRDVHDRVAHLPGVAATGTVSSLPLSGMVGWGGIKVEGFTPAPGQELQVDIRSASTDYFRTMQIPLRTGRFFSDHDTSGQQPLALIDDRFARRFWPHESAVGKHIWFDPKKPFTIVGVVGSVKQYGLDSDSKIVTYFPDQQQPGNLMFLVAQTPSVDPSSYASAITREIHAVEPTAAVFQIRTMQDRLYSSLARQRFATTMLTAFALFGLILAAIGVYGVMSYLVTQSTHDIGVRVALGAQPASVIRLVLQQGMSLTVLGIGVGLLGAAALTRVMAGLLFGVSSWDALTFFGVALLLGAIALLATYIPALRATRIDPIVALREE
jgi:putative ABC transport system permease protein